MQVNEGVFHRILSHLSIHLLANQNLRREKSQTKDPPLPLYQTFQVSTLAKKKKKKEKKRRRRRRGIEI